MKVKQKTIIVWNEVEKLEYLLVFDDWRRFNGVYINMIAPKGRTRNWRKLQDELYDLLFENGAKRTVTLEEARQHIVEGAHLIEAGFLP